MGIHDKFRERFTERQEKNRSETEELFLETLTGIGNWVSEAVKCLEIAQENSEFRDIGIQQAKRMLERLLEELY